MDRKLKILNILLTIQIVIGVLITPYGTFASYVMGGFGIALVVFLLAGGVLVYFPYYVKKSAASNNFTPSIIHAILVLMGNWLVLPLGIWQLYLAIKLKNSLAPENA
ncbi:MAG: hypothetical protein EP324_08100 [Gammaproteobacteria bacterium]|nr:MAG: hypothetical protein EP324_08100 [Gammaproteobacteria bacterium]